MTDPSGFSWLSTFFKALLDLDPNIFNPLKSPISPSGSDNPWAELDNVLKPPMHSPPFGVIIENFANGQDLAPPALDFGGIGLPDLFTGYSPTLPKKGFCSFTANVLGASQATKDAIQQTYNQAGVGIDFVNGDADLSVTNKALPHGQVGDDSSGSSAVVDMSQIGSGSLGSYISHEWGHYILDCVHLPYAADDCGNEGLMGPGTAFGHAGPNGVLPGDPSLSTWQFRPDQFPVIKKKCTDLHPQ